MIPGDGEISLDGGPTEKRPEAITPDQAQEKRPDTTTTSDTATTTEQTKEYFISGGGCRCAVANSNDSVFLIFGLFLLLLLVHRPSKRQP